MFLFFTEHSTSFRPVHCQGKCLGVSFSFASPVRGSFLGPGAELLMCQRPHSKPLLSSLVGGSRWDVFPSFSPSNPLGKGKKGIKGGHCWQGAGPGAPDSTCPGKGWSGGWGCPTRVWLILISPALFGQAVESKGSKAVGLLFSSFLAKGGHSKASALPTSSLLFFPFSLSPLEA